MKLITQYFKRRALLNELRPMAAMARQLQESYQRAADRRDTRLMGKRYAKLKAAKNACLAIENQIARLG